MVEFDWDPEKAAISLKKHGVSFSEAATVFSDPLSITVHDPDHSTEEERYLIVGVSNRSRLLIISFMERGESIRVISARELTRAERKQYENEIQS
jgi:uncharacterized DUF497 family protein